jgi:hypothetical protein
VRTPPMTDSRANPAPAEPDQPPTPSPNDPPPNGDPAADTPGGSSPADGPDEPDYKALYEQTRAKLTTAEQTARTHRDKAKKYDEHQTAQQTETERAAARAEAAEHQVTALRQRAVDAEIRAAATGWADPADAPLYLTDRDRYLGDDGEIDTAAITADLADVLTRRPHLARVDGQSASFRRPAPDPSQGARPAVAAGLDAQITDAEQAGDWKRAVALKSQRALELAQQRSTTP